MTGCCIRDNDEDAEDGEDGAFREGPNVLEEPEKVRSVLQVGLVLLADILDLVLDVVADVLRDRPGPELLL